MRLFRNETKEWYHIFSNGEEIVCTGGHPFYVVDEGFVEAKDLKIADKLLLSDGSYGIIEAVRAIHYDEPQTTYNFEVADFHTYYVGNGVCVHNRSQCSGKYKIDKKAMDPHTNGTDGKSQFLSGVDADEAVLKAADYADANDLWRGSNSSQARVPVANGPVGVRADTGELTNWLKVTRTKTNRIHGWPCRPN